MGLTRPRYHQLQETDFKNSCRVATTANKTLSGGAPATVDGINLQYADRVLVAGQTNASENGIYFVSVLGAGSNGTWIRARDADENLEITSGIVVEVTEGTIYANTQWKLTTPDPIVVGTTELTWENDLSRVTVDGEQTLSNKSLVNPVVTGAIINSTPATIVNTTATSIDTFDASAYRGAKYVVTVSNGSDYNITEAILVHNGTTATVTVYGEVYTNASLGEVTADINSGNVRLLYTGVSNNNSVKVAATYIST